MDTVLKLIFLLDSDSIIYLFIKFYIVFLLQFMLSFVYFLLVKLRDITYCKLILLLLLILFTIICISLNHSQWHHVHTKLLSVTKCMTIIICSAFLLITN